MGSAAERVVAIDWSGRVDAAGQRRHIVAGVWTQAAVACGRAGAVARARGAEAMVTLENGRTRDEVLEWLIGLARETPRMVVGFDFCFGFPEWFVRGEHGCQTGPEFWEVVTREHGERWLARGHADQRFWGKPWKRPAEFSGEGIHRMLRATDIDCKLIAHIPEEERAARVKGITPKSVFQIGGSGSVGTASLRGMPVLLRLRQAGFRVWPFDRPALAGAAPRPLVVEMYSAAKHRSCAQIERGSAAGLPRSEAHGGDGLRQAAAKRDGQGAGERGRLRCAGKHDGDGRAADAVRGAPPAARSQVHGRGMDVGAGCVCGQSPAISCGVGCTRAARRPGANRD